MTEQCEHPHPKKPGFLWQRLRSFRYAGRGLGWVIWSQANMWIHLIALVLVVGVGLALSISLTEWCLLVLVIGLVLAAETVNTAIELLVDLVSPEYHPLAGKIKDVAAAAVLITAITALLTGGLIFLPKIICLIH